MAEAVWVRGEIDGEQIIITPLNGDKSEARTMFLDEVEFILDRGLAGPCMDTAKDLTAQEYPVDTVEEEREEDKRYYRGGRWDF